MLADTRSDSRDFAMIIDEREAVDISAMPELNRLVDEVRASQRPRVLRRGSEEVAVLLPASFGRKRRRVRKPSAADYQAFLASAGGWKDVDTDKLIADIDESRRSQRPPAEP